MRYVNEALQQRGACHVALTGGATPRTLYALLAETENAASIDWRRLHIYFGDERYVPHDSEQSNYRMARTLLLDKVDLPKTNIHPIPTGAGDAATDAQVYAALLSRNLPLQNGIPVFDLILLGMGDDGHTASLFPDTPILSEVQKPVAAVYVDKLASWRISLTFPVLNAAQCVMLLVSGENKAPQVRRALEHDTHTRVPIQLLQPAHACFWYLDEAAARELNG